MLNISTMPRDKNRLLRLKTDQSGMASIFIVMVLMAILALISLGFSQLMNREVRQALDRQLSAEAYYAAESGLNDAKAYLADSTNQPSIPGCQNFSSISPGSDFFVKNGDISGDGNSKYPCLNINTDPNQLFFSLSAGESKTYRIGTSDAESFFFSWEKDKSGAALGSIPQLPKEDTINTKNGILRVAIYPVPQAGAANNTDLANASRNYFMYPEPGDGSSPGAVDYKTGTNGQFVSGNCKLNPSPGFTLPDGSTSSRFCNAKVNDLVTDGTYNAYFIKVTALYTPLIGTIQVADTAGRNQPIAHDQGVVDVTGAGSDVSRRIRSIISTQPEFDNPGNALWSMQAICKLFRVPVSGLGQYDGPSPDDSSGSSDNLCGLATPSNSGGPINGNPGGGGGTCTDPAATNFGGPLPCQYPGGGGGTCTDPAATNFGGPLPCQYPPPRTPVRTVLQSCLLPDGTIELGPIAGGVCRADGGASGAACEWTQPPTPTWGPCP